MFIRCFISWNLIRILRNPSSLPYYGTLLPWSIFVSYNSCCFFIINSNLKFKLAFVFPNKSIQVIKNCTNKRNWHFLWYVCIWHSIILQKYLHRCPAQKYTYLKFLKLIAHIKSSGMQLEMEIWRYGMAKTHKKVSMHFAINKYHMDHCTCLSVFTTL